MTSDPVSAIRGWCPGAHRPMMSGDGLVVRIRPFRAHLDTGEVRRLCALADRFGTGTLELTSRANLQIRGVALADHGALLDALDRAGLIDSDPEIERRRNILMTPDWTAGDLSDRLHGALLRQLPLLPALPAKMGIAIDTGAAAQLRQGSADMRFERTPDGQLLLRADGAARGRRIDEDTAMAALAALVDWFVATGGADSGRMARHLARVPLPEDWQQAAPRPDHHAPEIGPQPGGQILGVPFGLIRAGDLAALMTLGGASGLRLMTGRRLWLRDGAVRDAPGVVTRPGDPLMTVDACPGKPACPRATVETRALAARLAVLPRAGRLHVSGCAKGCARPGPAAVTLTGRDGCFDLVRNGRAQDDPVARALHPSRITDLSEYP